MKMPKPETGSIVPKKQRKADSKKLFMERLEHEGRADDYAKRLREVMVERGSTVVLACQHEAMLRCGLKTPDEERKLAADRGALIPESEVVLPDVKVDERVLGSLGLPMTAKPMDELEWVRAHPLMVRARQRKDRDPPVDIMLSQVTSPPHGRAPSVSAVSLLGFYLANPSVLYKDVMLSSRAGNAETPVESDKDIAGIAQLIKEVKGV